MSENVEIKKKKKIGCLGGFLITLAILVLIGGGLFIFLPKIISSAISGGAVSVLLPEEIIKETEAVQQLVKENLNQLEEAGLSRDDAVKIVSSIDFESLEQCITDIQETSISNTSELIDIIAVHVDLSTADIKNIKKKYYREIDKDELNEFIRGMKDSPMMMKSTFAVLKGTIVEMLDSTEKEN